MLCLNGKHFFFEEIQGETEVKVGFLICKDICIPGEANLKLGPSETFVANRKTTPYDHNTLEKEFEALPSETTLPEGFEFYLTRVKDEPKLNLHYSLKNVTRPSLPFELNFLTRGVLL